jgi:hypothetical protein
MIEIGTCEENRHSAPESECRVCLGEHDEAIHTATLDVHAWYRARVTRYFVKDDLSQQAVA